MRTRKYKSNKTRRQKKNQAKTRRKGLSLNKVARKLSTSKFRKGLSLNKVARGLSTSEFAFCNGSNIYANYDKKYKRHNKGLVILGPPGLGKTTFVRKNEDIIWKNGGKLDWIDQDDLLHELGVDWHFNSSNKDDFRLNYLRADYITEQSKQLGFWLIGSLFWEYKADAIVIPPWNIHSEYIKKRSDLDPNVVKDIRKLLFKHAKLMKIPIFSSIEEAVSKITA